MQAPEACTTFPEHVSALVANAPGFARPMQPLKWSVGRVPVLLTVTS